MNKPFMKITHDYLGGLRQMECNDDSMYILGSFLTSDVGSSARKWKELALENIAALGGSNFSSMYMHNGKLRIEEDWEERGKGPFIELSSEEFINVLDEWEKAYTKDTKEILITKEEDGTIKFEVKK